MNLVVLDVETGGSDPTKNPITQFAVQIVDPETFDIIYNYDNFVKPYNNLKIEKVALEYTRLSMQQINGGVDYKQLIRDIIDIAKRANKSGKSSSAGIIVGHNVGFDTGFLSYLFNYANKNFFDYFNFNPIDTLNLIKLYESGNLKSSGSTRYTLTACCERWGIKLHTAHGAPSDVDHTRKLLKNFFLKIRENGNKIKLHETDEDGNNKVQHPHGSRRNKPFFEF